MPMKNNYHFLSQFVKKIRFLPGVDVMITIFCDFCQLSAKNLAFFSKNNVLITIFAKFFGENI
jgi:hypothetical protein